MDEPGQGWRRHVVFGVKVLADFAKHGCIKRAITEVQAIHLLPSMENTLRDYEQYYKDRSTFDCPLFISVGQDSRSFWIFSIQGKGGPWIKCKHWICPNLSPVGIT